MSRRHRALAILAGLASLAWILLRSVRKPSRLAYPCQQAALGQVSILLGIPVAHVVRKLVARRVGPRRRTAVAVALVAAFLALGGLGDLAPTDLAASTAPPAPSPDLDPDYRAQIVVVRNAGGPAGDHHLGVDALLSGLAADGTALYASTASDPLAAPDGIVGADDVVLVKINQQWPERGGTNTDVLRGLVARILEHPDGFTGEIVVVENTQSQGSLDWEWANAEDPSQSARDVIHDFAAGGDPVYGLLWDTFRAVSVGEYADGDDTDGYVILPHDPVTDFEPSYPKFRTPAGTPVSLRYGVWDPQTQTYDPDRLVFLNVPVLKCHGAVYGVTGCVKHQVGTMTTTLGTGTHGAVADGACGRFLADVRRPDLHVLDAIRVLARPDEGPWCPYGRETRLDVLVGGTDPVAMDLWATANLLVPAIVANGYGSWPKQDPDDPTSIFRTYLDRSLAVMLAAGIDATNDPARIDVHEVDGAAVGVGEVPAPARPVGPVALAAPNPFREATTLRFEARAAGVHRLEVFDVRGRRVARRSADLAPGAAALAWDGRDDGGRRVPSGTYAWRITGPDGVRRGSVTRLR